MSQFPMNNQWMPQQWGVYQGAQTAPQWDMQRMAQDPQYMQQWQQMMGQQGGGQPLRQKPNMMGQQVYGQQGGGFVNPMQAMGMSAQSGGASFPGGLTGQQSGGASWPSGLTGAQSNYPWWGGPFQTPSVNGSTYSEMPAYEVPNWFNNAPWDYEKWMNYTPEQQAGLTNMNQQALNWTQMAQNYQQWQNEFNQNAYQWGNEFDWKKTGDQFSMDLATRQQDTSEKQWGDEFGLKSQEQADLNKWRDTQATLEREKMVTDQENAALASWGRKMRPNTRFM